MRRAATLLTATTATRPQPPHPTARAHLAQPRATPAPQHAHATARAQQPASSEIRLDHSTIVCDDQHDDLLKASRGLSLHPAKSSARGPSNNTITTIMSPRTPPRPRPSPPSVAPDRPPVTNKRVAQHCGSGRTVVSSSRHDRATGDAAMRIPATPSPPRRRRAPPSPLLSLRLRKRLCSPARTPRCRRSS